MEIISKELIFHEYTEEYINKNCVHNQLKSEKLEWNKQDNKNYQFYDDIVNSDIVFSIIDLKNNEEYGYFFFKKYPHNTGDEKIFIYEIIKVILDNKLPETYIRKQISYILNNLVNGNFLRKDRIFTDKSNYPFNDIHFTTTTEKVSNEIITHFQISRDGLTPISEEKLKRFTSKYKNGGVN